MISLTEIPKMQRVRKPEIREHSRPPCPRCPRQESYDSLLWSIENNRTLKRKKPLKMLLPPMVLPAQK